ncbi:MAG: hypothetical protein O9267_04395 [Flavobacterium sp.]|uniref:hypothetical protein n=1 Tax=Flavobacterium sp. TaxID=239 RepID=UPI0022C79173|nr:hypothetical protein [Flavobacterium sp.]MCZ8196826.1 hypothetical protein [Flavobacterium sp.]
MSTIELKNLVISKISEINDESFLLAINTILDSKSESILILSDDQKSSIKKSQKEYLEGNYFSNDSVNEEMEKWLKQ